MNEAFQTSLQQAGIWQANAFGYAFAIQLQLELEPEQSLKALVDCALGDHHVLRTTLTVPEGRRAPLQFIGDSFRPLFSEVSIEQLDASERERQLDEVIEKSLSEASSYDSSAAPLRVQAHRLSGSCACLTFTFTRLAADVGTLLAVQRAVAGLLARSHDSALLRPIQYLQFSEWQRTLPPTQSSAGAPAEPERAEPPTLPWERAGAVAGDATPKWLTFTVDARTRQALAAMSDQLDVGIEVTFASLWYLMLARLTATEAPVLDLAFDVRQAHAQLLEALGPMTVHIPVEVSCSAGVAYPQLVSQLAVRMREWQSMLAGGANVKEQAALGVPTRADAISLQYIRCSQPVTTRCRMRALRSASGRAKLQILCADDGEQLSIALRYDSARLHEAWTAALPEHFDALLRDVLGNFRRSTGELDVLSERQRQHLLVELNHPVDYDIRPDQRIHVQFEASASRFHDRIALADATTAWTYGELNASANGLAREIRRYSDVDGAFVAICLPPSMDGVLAVLAALKASATYVPIDPSLPLARRQQILRDASVKLVITTRDLSSLFAYDSLQLLCVDALARQGDGSLDLRATGDGENLSLPGSPSDAAYVLYTSGSTGKPKGVTVSHLSAVNLGNAHQERIYSRHGSPNMRVSLTAPLWFDGSVERILLLNYGHSIYVCSDEARHDPRVFIDYARQHELQALDVTPSYLQALIAQSLLSSLPAVQLVLIGGEPILPDLWSQLARTERMAFYNVYGPTECTVNASVACVADYPLHPTIGRPLLNVQIHILDEAGRQVANGTPGELYIGGLGVAKGYLNRERLTEEKFVSVVLGNGPPQRLYRTGDLGRYQPNGSIEFLGRVDGQVKIRGHRIELGEIQVLLRQHERVQDAVVTVHQTSSADRGLVAYVIPVAKPVSSESLRDWLRARLPDYMVPLTYVTLEAFPVNSSGKLDLKALPAPDLQTRQLSVPYVAPRISIEKAMAKLWATVLEVTPIGIDDNFFDLGGHSLRATQLIRAVSEAFSVDLPLRTLFDAPTIASFSRALLQRQLELSSRREPSGESHGA